MRDINVLGESFGKLNEKWYKALPECLVLGGSQKCVPLLQVWSLDPTGTPSTTHEVTYGRLDNSTFQNTKEEG